MTRREELQELCENKEASKLIDEILFLEQKLDEIKRLPFYKVNPDNIMQQKTLPAGRLYKELLQQYNSCLRVFANLSGYNMEDEESPLRKWVRGKLGGVMDAGKGKNDMDTG